jgi:hypothetical protein
MEFLPGAFEREWERRRATLLHEMQLGQSGTYNWDEPRKGGVALDPNERLGGLGRARWRHRDTGKGFLARACAGPAGRSMQTRFTALARGSQPAVVKLASYGGGARAAAMIAYISRTGELTVENESGERMSGRVAIAEPRSHWKSLFDNRAASRDIGVFQVSLEMAPLDAAGGGQDALVREILRAGFGDRRFVYAIKTISSHQLTISGVLVLRDSGGERLTGDSKAMVAVQERVDQSDLAKTVAARFRFHGYGNGVEYGAARVRDLVNRADGGVRDEAGRTVADACQASDLVRQEWRKDLHSRRGRDVMHLIVSARAGTDATAFQGAVRDFLGDQFAGHRYVFAKHDPADDPKETAKGGKRPHIHAHAIVTMRSETGERVETSPRVFRGWRAVLAEKAREHGIDMEMTDRREFATAPAYGRNQVRPVRYAGRTEHQGTSVAAAIRYHAKRTNGRQAARSMRSEAYASAAARTWRGLAATNEEAKIAAYARYQVERIEQAFMRSQSGSENLVMLPKGINIVSNMVSLREFVRGDETDMREMTRPEFEAYEARVETVLSTVERSLHIRERDEFEEIAAAAREVVSIRREYLAFIERQVVREREPPLSDNEVWDRAVATHGEAVVEQGNDALIEVETAREAIDRAEDHDRPTVSALANLQRELERAARLALAGNTYLREVSEIDLDLRRAIEAIVRTEQTRLDLENGQALTPHADRPRPTRDHRGVPRPSQTEGPTERPPTQPQQLSLRLRGFDRRMEERRERGGGARER